MTPMNRWTHKVRETLVSRWVTKTLVYFLYIYFPWFKFADKQKGKLCNVCFICHIKIKLTTFRNILKAFTCCTYWPLGSSSSWGGGNHLIFYSHIYIYIHTHTHTHTHTHPHTHRIFLTTHATGKMHQYLLLLIHY